MDRTQINNLSDREIVDLYDWWSWSLYEEYMMDPSEENVGRFIEFYSNLEGFEIEPATEEELEARAKFEEMLVERVRELC